jgi:hypothetical protein
VKPEYREGTEARKNFEETMQKLFRALKPPKKATPSARAVSPAEKEK